jgi:hypothetical protein
MEERLHIALLFKKMRKKYRAFSAGFRAGVGVFARVSGNRKGNLQRLGVEVLREQE